MADKELPEFEEEEDLDLEDASAEEETFIEDDGEDVATMEVEAQEEEFEEEEAPVARKRGGAKRRSPGRPAGRMKAKSDGPGFFGVMLVFFSILLMVAGTVSCAVNISEPGERELWVLGGLGGSFLGLWGLGSYFSKWGAL